MNLTNEEKKAIADSATMLMQRFCEYQMAQDRLKTMNEFVSNQLHMQLDREMIASALAPYGERMRKAQMEFFMTLGIEESNKDFWVYNARVEATKQVPTPKEKASPKPKANFDESTVEG
jgi:hypothetical protein